MRKLLTDETARIVACSIATRLDYCNAVLYGALAATLNKLQRVQNNLARAVCRRGGRADGRPLLKSLHWLPLNHCITYKVAVLTYKLRWTSTPPYLSTLLQPVTSSRSLRSVDSFWLQVQRTRTEFGRQAFSVAAPTVWNSLPNKLRQSSSVPIFKKHLSRYYSVPRSRDTITPLSLYLHDIMALYKF